MSPVCEASRKAFADVRLPSTQDFGNGNKGLAAQEYLIFGKLALKVPCDILWQKEFKDCFIVFEYFF